jgi:hypothetical protein
MGKKKSAAKKKKVKPAPRHAAKKVAAKKAKSPPAAKARKGTRPSWLDAASHKPMIDQYARQLTSFIEAMADGQIDESELKAQEARLARLMKEIEPRLDDALHEKVTKLLCELTAYDLMQVLHSMQEHRPETQFQG